MKKRILSMMVAATMVMTMLAGCGEKDAGGEAASYTIGISQFAEHGSLDNCREGFIEGLAEAGIVEGENLTIEYKNAAADMGTASQISSSFVSDEVDLICAIATPSAQAAYNAAMDAEIPVIFTAVTENRLADVEIKWKDERAVCVVMASGGYPGSYEKGKVITGLNDVDEDVVVFHAGTKFAEDGAIATSGGRVLGVTATGATHEEAKAKAYENVKKISFEGAQYRNDIGTINNTEK